MGRDKKQCRDATLAEELKWGQIWHVWAPGGVLESESWRLKPVLEGDCIPLGSSLPSAHSGWDAFTAIVCPDQGGFFRKATSKKTVHGVIKDCCLGQWKPNKTYVECRSQDRAVRVTSPMWWSRLGRVFPVFMHSLGSQRFLRDPSGMKGRSYCLGPNNVRIYTPALQSTWKK